MNIKRVIASMLITGLLACNFNAYAAEEEDEKIDIKYQTCYPEDLQTSIIEYEHEIEVVEYETNELIWKAELVDQDMFTSTNVYARTIPNTADKTQLCLPTGTEIHRIGISDNGWDIIEYDNKMYYMWYEYIVEEKPELKVTTYSGSYSDIDIYYLQRVAETETRGADMMSKTHVVSVVLNRCKLYGQSPYNIIIAPNQFAYGRTSISQSSIDAVNYVLEHGDTARGALFFHSGAYTSTFCKHSYIFTDDVGHHFY